MSLGIKGGSGIGLSHYCTQYPLTECLLSVFATLGSAGPEVGFHVGEMFPPGDAKTALLVWEWKLPIGPLGLLVLLN